ncbi:MAG: hypothetical protein WBE37_03205 [Bryobacteraceae bacterium]
MYRLFCFLLCASLLPVGASAEVICALGARVSSYDAKLDQRPTADAMQLAGRMNAALSPTCTPQCPQIAIYRNTTAPNAMLVVTSDQAKFVYAPQFFSDVYDKYGDGAIIAIIAHLYGHALNEVHPAPWMKTEWTQELRADAWAGCALAKSDQSSNDLAEALTAVSKYPPPNDSNWSLRVSALRLGYINCGGDGSKFDSAVKVR